MHFDKAIKAQLVSQGTMSCNDTFLHLVRQISELPNDVRGTQALNLSAHLVEMAAYELAGHLDSSEIGALIKCAAELSTRSDDLAQDRLSGTRPDFALVQ